MLTGTYTPPVHSLNPDPALSDPFCGPDISVVIVNWNTKELLANCLETLEQHHDNLYLEIVVVDNGSTDGSLPLLEERFPGVVILANQSNVGFGRANNQAFRLSRGRYVLLLNSDTLVQAGALTRLVNFLDANPSVGMVGAHLLNHDGSLQPSWARFPSVWSEWAGKNPRARRPYPTQDGSPAYAVDWVGGACILVRRFVIEQTGGFDEGYFMYSEEMDWCYRTRQLGWDICYLPEARVTHLGGQSSRKASTHMKVELYRSKLQFFASHYGLARAALLGRGYFVRFWAKSALGRLLRAAGLMNETESQRQAEEYALLRQMLAEFFATLKQ